MSLVTGIDITVAFGGKPVMTGVDFAVQPADKIGLIGPNGSGKTTLLRLLAGEREPDEGEVRWARGVRAGYLPQDIQELPGGTLVESVRAAIGGREQMLADLAAVEQELPGAQDEEETLELASRIAELHAQLDAF